MDTIKTGGPAFPVPGLQHDEDFNGMTLRDHFAAKALEPATLMGWAELEYKPQDGMSIIENNARLAYQIADAMLTARRGARNGHEQLVELTKRAQEILGAYLLPDGSSDREAITALLELFDGPDSRAALAAAGA